MKSSINNFSSDSKEALSFRPDWAKQVRQTEKKIKEMVASSETTEPSLWDEGKLEILHDKIMSQIETKKPRSKKWFWFKSLGSFSTVMTMTLILAAWPRTQGSEEGLASGLLLNSVLERPAQATEFFSYQLQDEFLMDVASQTVDDKISQVIQKIGESQE